jgi:hypothetical protein
VLLGPRSGCWNSGCPTSALLRSFVAAPERGKLWLGMSQVGNARLIRDVDRAAVQRWVRRFGVLGGDGGPMKVHRARIRTTHQSMRDKTAAPYRGDAQARPGTAPRPGPASANQMQRADPPPEAARPA